MTENTLQQGNDLQTQKNFINTLFDSVTAHMNLAMKFDDEYRQKIVATLTEIRADIDNRFKEL